MENFWKKMVDQVAFVDYNPWENIYEKDPSDISKPCSDLWKVASNCADFRSTTEATEMLACRIGGLPIQARQKSRLPSKQPLRHLCGCSDVA